MKKYNAYKDSGVSWMGEVPEHWGVKRLATFFTENKNINHNLELTNAFKFNYGNLVRKDEGVNPLELVDTYSKYTKLKVRDIVINGLNLNYDFVSQRIAQAKSEGIITSAYLVLTPRKDVEEEYYCYVFRAMDSMKLFHGMGTGIRLTLSYKDLKTKPLPLPPPSEQRAIVAYLDQKVGDIDRLIEKTETKIAQLKELKQATIAQAVTQGIDPNVPLKDSGIAWIGKVPEHWEEKNLRHFLQLYSEKNHPEEKLLSVVRDQGVIIRDLESKEENHNYVPDDLSGYKFIDKGEFVINKMKAWQGSYAVSNYRGIVSPAYYTCHLRFENKEFFNTAIRSRAYIPFFTQYSKGIRVGQWDLSPISLKSIPFFLPPPSEQRAIVAYITAKTEKIDRLMDRESQIVERLKELKQRLISDAVTGKIKVAPNA